MSQSLHASNMDEARELLQSCLPVVEQAVVSAKEWGDGDDISYLIDLTTKLDAFLKNDLEEDPSNSGEPFQMSVCRWLLLCFGPKIASDITERNHRFLEEALELVQSKGCTRSEAQQLVEYVFDRPAGEPFQEVGGVMVTLAALCHAAGLSMEDAANTELERVYTKIDKIREKQAAKPKHSPLPVTPPASTESKSLEDIFWENWAGHFSIRKQQAAPAIKAVEAAVRARYKGELEELKATVSDMEIRHAAVMLHTQGVVDENTRLTTMANENAVLAAENVRKDALLEDAAGALQSAAITLHDAGCPDNAERAEEAAARLAQKGKS